MTIYAGLDQIRASNWAGAGDDRWADESEERRQGISSGRREERRRKGG
jgi:hypothetical protein